MKTHIIGLPTIGEKRELKFSIEKYLKNKTKINKTLIKITQNNIFKKNIKLQQKNIDILTIGNNYLNDPITHTMCVLNICNKKYTKNKKLTINNIIKFTKGINNTKPFKMTKWFGTNYHYFIPKLTKRDLKIKYTQKTNKSEFKNTKNIKNIKFSIIGPITFIKLCKIKKTKPIIKNILNRYYKTIKNLKNKKHIKWIQIEEPILNNKNIKKYIKVINFYTKKLKNNTKEKLLIITYLNNFSKQPKILKQKYIDGTNINIYKNKPNKNIIKKNIKNKIISLDIIDGKNIWISNIKKIIKDIKIFNKHKNIWISTNCSLIHIPYNNKNENFKNKPWTAFAKQKIKELKIIKKTLNNKNNIYKNFILKNKKLSNKINKSKITIKKYIKKIIKNNIFVNKKKSLVTKKTFNLKNLTNTTIGSFSQTKKIRTLRNKFKKNKISKKKYIKKIKNYINKIIQIQKNNKIDVITNGEIERNDMVEYFCENLKGCSITKNGWVQSYSTRCVKPAIIWGKIKNKIIITKTWNNQLYKNCKNKSKAIITGPITMTKWSFKRNDISNHHTNIMFSNFINKEIKNIIKNNIKIIQVDEPALKEALPKNKKLKKLYNNQVKKSFNIACKTAYKNNIQIHTHICYSELTKKDLNLIKNMGVDVISIESSKNLKKNLELIKKTKLYKNMEIGLGVYDVHSKIIPSKKKLIKNIKKILKYINIKRIWINPDCGLKTRQEKEIIIYLKNIKHAIKNIKNSYNIK